MDNDIMNASLTDVLGTDSLDTYAKGSGGHILSLGNGIYKVTMPDGDTLYVDGTGKIIG